MAEQPHHDLGFDEFLLAGRWDGHEESGTQTDAEMNLDVVEARIRWLIANRLVALGSAADGWDWLFRDPNDGRLWELTFPYGSLHGSGPRQLAVVETEFAAAKYGIDSSLEQ
jgi:hypothetical protein